MKTDKRVLRTARTKNWNPHPARPANFAMRLTCVVLAATAAFGAGLAGVCLLGLLEGAVLVPNSDAGEVYGAYRGIFGYPSNNVIVPVIAVFAAIGFGCAWQAATRTSKVWRFHVPYGFGLFFLGAALVIAVVTIRNAHFWSGNVAVLAFWPAIYQVIVLTVFGLVTLVWACFRPE